jgi:HK97 family phage prohead protease
MHSKTFEGLACDWSTIQTNSKRVRYHRNAFDKFASRAESQATPLLVNHDARLKLAKGEMKPYFIANDDGLWVRFSLDLDDFLTAGAAAAIKFGWLPGLSIASNMTGSHWATDDHGRYQFALQAGLDELSICDSPACAAACVAADGRSVATTRKLPEDPIEHTRLVAFLRRVGIDPAVTSTPVRRPAQIAVPARPAKVVASRPATPARKPTNATQQPAYPSLSEIYAMTNAQQLAWARGK